MERDDRNLLIVGALVILVILVGFYFLLLAPLRSNYAQRVEEKNNKQTQLNQIRQQVSNLEEVRRNSPEIERQLLELAKRIPEQPEIPTLLVQIEEVSRAANVTQLSIDPGTPEPPPGGGDFQRIPITMSFEGTYAQMEDWLRRVRNLARLVTINEVTYAPAQQGGGTTTSEPGIERQLQVDVNAEVYTQSPGGATGSTGPVAPAAPPTPAPGSTSGSVPGGSSVGSTAGPDESAQGGATGGP